jgi:hypothetical protein
MPAKKTFIIKNFYLEDEVIALQPKYHNPNKDYHGLSLPFRALVVGASGSGKTNIVANMLNALTDTFNEFYLFTRDLSEPLYEHLRNKMSNQRTGRLNEHVHLNEGLDELNTMDLKTGFPEDSQILIVFDDLVAERHQQKIEELFLRGRKISNGISLVYITQSYYRVPRLIRLNLSYLILRKVSSSRDVNMILRECSLGISNEELVALYKRTVGTSIVNFLFVDLTNAQRPFRKNLNDDV